MTAMRPLVVKEFRALFPLWLGCLVTLCAYPLTDNNELQMIAVLAFALGPVALGAHAIGHEYSYKTMGLLLALPIERRRLLMVKLFVTAAMIAVLTAAAWPLVLIHVQPRPALPVVLLPLFGGLFVAPWLTMVARNQLAGGVFTIGIAGSTFVALEFVSGDGFGGGSAEEAARLVVVARILIAFSALAAMFAWRAFMRLESTESAGPDLHLPRVSARFDRDRPGTRQASPVWLLIRKELRLQQMSLVLAAFYALAWVMLLARFPDASVEDRQRATMIFGPVTLIYFWGLSSLIGALASAEERQFGVLESQQLLPMAAWRQWLVKASVAIGLSVVLTVLLPRVLIEIGGRFGLLLSGHVPGIAATALIVTVVTAGGLYVSSISGSGIKAAALVFPFLLGASWLLGVVGRAIASSGILARSSVATGIDDLSLQIAAVGFTVLLLVFGAQNHRSSERSIRHIAGQLGGAAALIVIGIPLITVILLAI